MDLIGLFCEKLSIEEYVFWMKIMRIGDSDFFREKLLFLFSTRNTIERRFVYEKYILARYKGSKSLLG